MLLTNTDDSSPQQPAPPSAWQTGRIWRKTGVKNRSGEDLSATETTLMGLLKRGRVGFNAKTLL